MTSNERYNGWTNYETWTVALWIDNERASYEFWRRQAFHAWEQAEAGSCEQAAMLEEARWRLGLLLKEALVQGVPFPGSHVYDDLLRSAIAEVNFAEIAEHLLAVVVESRAA